MATPNLLVEIHLTDGKIERFETNDPTQASLLGELLHPTKVFASPGLMFSEPHCLSSFRTQSIVRIDVSGSSCPNWPYLSNASSIREVTEAEFEQVRASEDLAQERMEAWHKPGTHQEGFTELVLTTGKRIIWRVTMISTEMVAVDSIAVARHLLGATALHGHRSDNVVMIVNMAHVARLSFYPGPPQSHSRIPVVHRA